MPHPRRPYPAEFRRQIVELVRSGRDPTDVAREFEPSAQAIRNWVAQADRTEDRREAKTETLTAAEQLVKEGFTVLPYINADPVLARRLQPLPERRRKLGAVHRGHRRDQRAV